MTPIHEALQSARSLGDWGFVLVIVFVGAVVFCTIAEKLSGQQSSKSLWKASQIIAGVLLIGALAMEYLGHKRETRILDSDNAALLKQTESAQQFSKMVGMTNALLVSSNLAMADRIEQLRKANDELEAMQLPMDVGTPRAFKESLQDGPPTPVFIASRVGNFKASQTADQLLFNLNSAGWHVYGTNETRENAEGITLMANPGQSEKALDVLFKAFLDRNIPGRIMLRENRTISPTNAIYIVVGERPHPRIAAGLILSGRRHLALRALDAYITGHPNMTTNELSEASQLGEEVLKFYAERIKGTVKDEKRDGVTNIMSRITLFASSSVTVSNGIPVEYVSGSNAIPFTPITISNWNKLVEGTLGTHSN